MEIRWKVGQPRSLHRVATATASKLDIASSAKLYSIWFITAKRGNGQRWRNFSRVNCKPLSPSDRPTIYINSKVSDLPAKLCRLSVFNSIAKCSHSLNPRFSMSSPTWFFLRKETTSSTETEEAAMIETTMQSCINLRDKLSTRHKRKKERRKKGTG